MEEGAGRTFVQREATGKASGGCVAIRKRSPSFVTGNQLAGWVAVTAHAQRVLPGTHVASDA